MYNMFCRDRVWRCTVDRIQDNSCEIVSDRIMKSRPISPYAKYNINLP